MKKNQQVQAIIVQWLGVDEFVVLTANPTKAKKIMARIEKKLQKETNDEYTSDDLRMALRGKMLCTPLNGKNYQMLP
jgi:GTP cyclohydrolase II